MSATLAANAANNNPNRCAHANRANMTNEEWTAYKIDTILEAMAGIRTMEDEIAFLEVMQNSTVPTDRPVPGHIDMLDAVCNDAKNTCMNLIRGLSQDEMRLFATRTQR
jgi:hypothetical protein